jgi:hypothetical protein
MHFYIKYESAIEKAAVEAFKKEFERIHCRICFASGMVRMMGFFAFENIIDKEKALNGDLLEYGFQLVASAIDRSIIEQIIDSWIKANCSGHCEYYTKILLSAIKIGVVNIASGENTLAIERRITSVVPFELMPNCTEFYPETVKQHGWMLKFMPEAFRTEELCKEAVKNCGWALESVPEKFKTKELCNEAVENAGIALNYVPEEFKTKEFCMKAFKKDSMALGAIPPEFKTVELCIEAVRQCGSALIFVPEEFKTAELCLEAVKNSDFAVAINCVPEPLKTAELYTEVIKLRRKDESMEGMELKILLDEVPESMRNEVWEAVYQSELEGKSNYGNKKPLF